jgi:hypothetical protein
MDRRATCDRTWPLPAGTRSAIPPGIVSLNRFEDALMRYLRAHPDELRFWKARVLEVDRVGGSLVTRSSTIERELRAYAVERAGVDRDLAEAIGAGIVSLRNLAEHLLAVWPPPRPQVRKPPA